MAAGNRVLRLAIGASGASLANLAVSVLAGILLARTAGPAGTGLMNLALTVATFVATLLSAGTGLALRFLCAGRPGRDHVSSYLGYSILITPAAGLLTVLAFFVFLGERPTIMLGLAVTALGGANLASKQCQELAQAHGDVMRSIRSTGVGTVVRIGALLLAAWLWTGDQVAVAWSFVAGVAVQGIYAVRPFGAIAKAREGLSRIREQATRRIVANLVRIGRPSLGYSLGIVGLQRTDRVVIATFLGARELGFYVVAATLAEIMRVATAPLGQLVFVRVTKEKRLSAGTGQLVLAGVLGQVVLGAFLWFTAPWLISALYGSEFGAAVPLVRGLVVAEIFMGLVLMESRAVLGLGQMGRMGRDTLALLVVCLPAYGYLIWQHGLAGAIVASVIAYAAYALVTHIALRHSLRTSPRE